jgi:anion-transporting  ArsA/GET3 family ATPase
VRQITGKSFAVDRFAMPGYDELADTFRRRREDIQKGFDDTSVSQEETSRLLDKIEELRRRSEATNRVFEKPSS